MAFEDRISGIVAKLNRARQTIAELKAKTEAWERAAVSQIEIKKGFLQSPTIYSVRARSEETVPAEFAVVAGEIIHALRSSLDHLVCALAVEAGGEIKRSHQYPICKSAAEFQKAVQRGLLAGLTDAAIAQIEGQQPYHSPQPENQAAAIINELDNRDKHRLLIAVNATAIIPDQIHVHGEGANITGISPPDPISLGPDFQEVFNITLAEPCADFRLEFGLHSEVALADVGRLGMNPMVATIEQAFQAISEAIAGYRPHFA